MSIILVGYRGSGKTTIGKKLADRLWQTFVDTDDMVAKAAGKTIKQIFEEDGEAKFRELEIAAVRDACATSDHVIALGGGAVTRQENRDAVKQSGHKVVYLRCDPQVLLKRIESDPTTATTRPNLTTMGGGIEEIRTLLAVREPLYRQLLTFELDVTNLSPEEAYVHITRVM
jgi:shikimate kinase